MASTAARAPRAVATTTGTSSNRLTTSASGATCPAPSASNTTASTGVVSSVAIALSTDSAVTKRRFSIVSASERLLDEAASMATTSTDPESTVFFRLCRPLLGHKILAEGNSEPSVKRPKNPGSYGTSDVGRYNRALRERRVSLIAMVVDRACSAPLSERRPGRARVSVAASAAALAILGACSDDVPGAGTDTRKADASQRDAFFDSTPSIRSVDASTHSKDASR